MAGTAYLYRMPAGIAGDVTRAEHALIEPNQIDSATPPTAFGTFVKLVAGKTQPLASGDAASVVYGVLVRDFPTQGSDALATVAKTKGMTSILRRGYIMAVLANGTAAKGAPVFVRVTAGSGRAVGAIETAADSGNCVQVNATFMGPADADGNVEIAYNI